MPKILLVKQTFCLSWGFGQPAGITYKTATATCYTRGLHSPHAVGYCVKISAEGWSRLPQMNLSPFVSLSYIWKMQEGPRHKAIDKKMPRSVPHPPPPLEVRLGDEGWNIYQMFGSSYKLAWVSNSQSDQKFSDSAQEIVKRWKKEVTVHVSMQQPKEYDKYICKYSFICVYHDYMPWISTF